MNRLSFKQNAFELSESRVVSIIDPNSIGPRFHVFHHSGFCFRYMCVCVCFNYIHCTFEYIFSRTRICACNISTPQPQRIFHASDERLSSRVCKYSPSCIAASLVDEFPHIYYGILLRALCLSHYYSTIDLSWTHIFTIPNKQSIRHQVWSRTNAARGTECIRNYITIWVK